MAVQLWRWVPGRVCLDVGTQPESAVAYAAGELAPQTGAGLFVLLQPCTVALPLQCWLIALSLSVSPLVLFSQTCHLVLPGAGTPVGHFFSPFSSELILASPSLIFHCLSPLSPPQLSPLGTASYSSDCMSSGTTPLTAVMLAGSHPRRPSISSCTVPRSFPRWHCTACPGQAPGCPWVRCPFCAEGPSHTLCLGCG